jgi:hypothetical protein
MFMHIHILPYYKLFPYFNINSYPATETLSKIYRYLPTGFATGSMMSRRNIQYLICVLVLFLLTQILIRQWISRPVGRYRYILDSVSVAG